ncbi:hypothetical protein JQ628_08035 [Bradyrhizobium lablabi]|uniref:hypothetical protein n=1 Tax=Bradyrhizobium lablabi TaxID=722472 RepID=UPI001BA4BE2A|nr:hypothetical protein [Bradyrhizobium lablabi]MBR1121455.1 hypothetical protein [Bradyrhizobium lablabi]
MRILVSMFVAAALLLNSGCAVYDMETRNRGGYLDSVLDRHWLRADSKSMRALRAFAMQVSLARIASVSAKNESDRQLLAIRIGALTKRFMPIYMCAFNNNPLAVPEAKNDPCFYYDSAMVDYSTGLFDLAMIALPFDDAKALMSTVSGGVNPINVIDLLTSLVQIGRDALKYGRVVGALYRDTVELEVQVWIGTPAIDTRPPPYQVTPADIAPLYEIYIRGNDDMPAWIAEMAALRGRGLEPFPQQKFFYELAGLMNYICDLITSDPKSNNPNTCKANLPAISVAPVAALGPSVPFKIGDLRVTRTGNVGPAGGQRSDRGGPSPGSDLSQKMGGAIPPVETTITVTDGQKFQKMLCVQASGTFDTPTRQQLKNFNRATLFPTDKDAVDRVANDAILGRLRDASRLFPDCRKAGFSNALEVGLFTRLELARTPFYPMLNKALQAEGIPPLAAPAAPSTAIDDAARQAISKLKTKYGLPSDGDVTLEFYAKMNPER